jgi:hypothetical protein
MSSLEKTVHLKLGAADKELKFKTNETPQEIQTRILTLLNADVSSSILKLVNSDNQCIPVGPNMPENSKESPYLARASEPSDVATNALFTASQDLDKIANQITVISSNFSGCRSLLLPFPVTRKHIASNPP